MKKNELLIALSLIFVMSCSILQEDDITNDEVFLIAPADTVTVNSKKVTFKWDLLEGATTYNLRVVKPSFARTSEIKLDTFLTNLDLFTYNLADGQYEWGIVALNSEYQTALYYRGMTVKDTLETIDIRDDQLTVISPLNNTSTTVRKILFFWERLEGAKTYELLIYTTATLDKPSKLLVENTNMTTNRVEISLEVGTYDWKVKAKNALYESLETEQKITITEIVVPVP